MDVFTEVGVVSSRWIGVYGQTNGRPSAGLGLDFASLGSDLQIVSDQRDLPDVFLLEFPFQGGSLTEAYTKAQPLYLNQAIP